MSQFFKFPISKIKSIARIVLDKSYPLIHKRTLHNHRLAIAREIFLKFGGTVKYGPFKGLHLAFRLSDVSPDFPSMFFGSYEEELLNELASLPKSYENFINLGAGDGYYPIGALKSGIFKKSIAYEENQSRRNQIKRLAEKNNCQDNLEIRGYADESCFEGYTPEFLSKSVILSDIEGGEFTLFNETNFYTLSSSIVLIEIHDFLVKDGQAKLESLLKIADKYFEITTLTTTRRDPSQYPELISFSDIDRWLTVVEGRGPLMIWLLLKPKLLSTVISTN